MNILWLTWKDELHPEAGGAEIVCQELTKRLVADGHQVTLLTSQYAQAPKRSKLNGVDVIRVGSNRYTHPLLALIYYIRHLRNTFDIVIEEVEGGAPYFSIFFGHKARRFLLYHQLGRRNWLYEIKSPFSYVGYYLLVPVATRLLSLARVPVITVSESTRQELAKFGLSEQRTFIISEGFQNEPVTDISQVEKYTDPTVLSHGSMRAMKRTIDQIKAFEIAKKDLPNLKMKISGSSSGKYGASVLACIAASPYKHDIEYLGRTSDKQKLTLMRKCHAILVTSIEEGWGLIVTEANSQGTPAVVYDVSGLRDSVKNHKTGMVTKAQPEALAEGIIALLQDSKAYQSLRERAWSWSKRITFDQSYRDFVTILDLP